MKVWGGVIEKESMGDAVISFIEAQLDCSALIIIESWHQNKILSQKEQEKSKSMIWLRET